MKTKIALGLILASSLAHATPNNNVYVELGGNGAGYTFNFEHYIADTDVGLRAGLGGFWADNYSAISAPLMVNKLWANPASNHKFETGLGVTYFALNKSSWLDPKYSTVMGTASVGYKYIPKAGGITFKATFTPIFNQDIMLPWVGFSIGHSF